MLLRRLLKCFWGINLIIHGSRYSLSLGEPLDLLVDYLPHVFVFEDARDYLLSLYFRLSRWAAPRRDVFNLGVINVSPIILINRWVLLSVLIFLWVICALWVRRVYLYVRWTQDFSIIFLSFALSCGWVKGYCLFGAEGTFIYQLCSFLESLDLHFRQLVCHPGHYLALLFLLTLIVPQPRRRLRVTCALLLDI